MLFQVKNDKRKAEWGHQSRPWFLTAVFLTIGFWSTRNWLSNVNIHFFHPKNCTFKSFSMTDLDYVFTFEKCSVNVLWKKKNPANLGFSTSFLLVHLFLHLAKQKEVEQQRCYHWDKQLQTCSVRRKRYREATVKMTWCPGEIFSKEHLGNRFHNNGFQWNQIWDHIKNRCWPLRKSGHIHLLFNRVISWTKYYPI